MRFIARIATFGTTFAPGPKSFTWLGIDDSLTVG